MVTLYTFYLFQSSFLNKVHSFMTVVGKSIPVLLAVARITYCRDYVIFLLSGHLPACLYFPINDDLVAWSVSSARVLSQTSLQVSVPSQPLFSFSTFNLVLYTLHLLFSLLFLHTFHIQKLLVVVSRPNLMYTIGDDFTNVD